MSERGFKNPHEHVETGAVYARDGKRWWVVGYITEPAVILHEVGGSGWDTVVVCAPIAQEYERVDEPEASYWRGFVEGRRTA